MPARSPPREETFQWKVSPSGDRADTWPRKARPASPARRRAGTAARGWTASGRRRPCPDRGATQATMTQTAQVIGTAQYLSPEQARGERVDTRSDLYSTGCLMYELLVGRPPFTGDSPGAIAYPHARE